MRTITATRHDPRSSEHVVLAPADDRQLLFDFANRLLHGKTISGATITTRPATGLDVSEVSHTATTVSCRIEPTNSPDRDFRLSAHVSIQGTQDVIGIACDIQVRD